MNEIQQNLFTSSNADGDYASMPHGGNSGNDEHDGAFNEFQVANDHDLDNDDDQLL